MNQNEYKYDYNEYVFVEFDAMGREKEGCDIAVKKKEEKCAGKSLCSSDALQDGENLDDCDDDFSISSFDLCDEELAIDTSNADMKHDKQGRDDIDDDDDESLRLSQSPSVASVCTETLFESMKDQGADVSSSVSTMATDNKSESMTFTNTKKSRARSESNANSTASSSSTAGYSNATSLCPSASRLSNKKRRKKIKQQKKAAAAAAAAEALAAANSRLKQANTPTVNVASTSAKQKKKCNATATSIAVLCATQSLTQYRQEIGLLNVNGQAHGHALKSHDLKETGSHGLNLIHSI
mmetsp:Transcript_4050/g.7772  ORF Transcript_4050/g.7772 Transcript_4050/m.7772 type:complete len:296 (+) Transcript_4050:102-989(+)